MKVKVEELVKISSDIDSILHKHGFSVDHDILALYILRVIKLSYPQDDVELDRPNLTPLLEKYEQEHIKDS